MEHLIDLAGQGDLLTICCAVIEQYSWCDIDYYGEYKETDMEFSKSPQTLINDGDDSIHDTAVAYNGTHLFLVGGRSTKEYKLVSSIQVYDIANDTWSILEGTLKTSRENATATIIKNKLYVTGGFYDNDDAGIRLSRIPLSSTEVFVISSSSCEPCDDHGIPDLKVWRCDHASVTIKDEIYFLGGWLLGVKDTSSSFESINVTTGEVTELPPLNQARSDFSAVVLDGDIIA